MTSVELRKKLKELNEGILRTETDLNNLSQQQKDCNRKLSQISARIGIANKKLQDKKNTYFRTQIELDTRISEEKTKQRQVEIDKKKKVLPTFEQWLKKEFKDLITETTDLGIPLGINVSEVSLYDRYVKIRDDRFPTKENVILTESMNRYDELLTCLIEKEIDGGRVDLMEKRNLKLPVVNFLNNTVIKDSLQI
jgi:DNA gyrase/topoisomerase IV subunit A|tara:strand:- start:308 stop:892 length:585 start_codon:yes stop_codon:yes gene_type:complete